MLERDTLEHVEQGLQRQVCVALLGPRQVGKTTLAHAIAARHNALYLDLESQEDRAKLANPRLFLTPLQDQLVILDEIHRVPELFQDLRGIIDEGRRQGYRTNRFLILGSASIDLLRQSESLAGRISYIDMPPLMLREVQPDYSVAQLWLRGGFPDSLLAGSDEDSFILRQDFLRSYRERDIPMFGGRLPAETLERFWTMLAHLQGSLLNSANLSRNLGLNTRTVNTYLDLFVDLLLLRRLPPYYKNIGKRLVKSPKMYIRDTGLLHALLRIITPHDLLGHPIVGISWESFVIETLINAAPYGTLASFYRTARGAEVDLVLELPGQLKPWIIEIKSSSSAKPSRGFYSAKADLTPEKAFVVYRGEEQYPLAEDITAISVGALATQLQQGRHNT